MLVLHAAAHGGSLALWGEVPFEHSVEGGPRRGRPRKKPELPPPPRCGASFDLLDDALRRSVVVRGQKVILDSDLAQLYGVPTKVLVQAVKRNLARFPPDFMVQLSEQEFSNLRSQIVTSSAHGGRRSRPYAFTEQGVAMLSSVLRSPRAIAVNIEIMRTFVRLRQMVAEHHDLALRLDELENRYDGQFKVVGGVSASGLMTAEAAAPTDSQREAFGVRQP